MTSPAGENRLSREQKTGFVLLLVFGLLVVGLGFLQMRNTIYGPFVSSDGQGQAAPVHTLFDEETRLQQIDTDQDGLNDYEELQFFKTSPYLPDTDSDGIIDKVELDTGTNPLCPEGEDCSRFVETVADEEPTLELSVPDVETPTDLIGDAASLTDVGADASIDLDSLAQDADALRQILLSSGNITEEQLASIDDQTLLLLAEEVLSEESAQ